MKRVVLDMDPGVDDAMVLLLALNDPEVELAGITTVSGNVSLFKGTTNALRVLQALGRPDGVYMGAPRSATPGNIMRAESAHGADGLGNCGLPPPLRRSEKMRASEMMHELLKSSRRGEVHVVATGPLTNVAALLQAEPSLAKKLAGIFVMGGLYDFTTQGNVTEFAEFNFFVDPISADIVMRSCSRGNPSLTVTGLELTSVPECAITTNSLSMIRKKDTLTANLASRILEWPVLTFSYFNLHDVFALAALLRPQLFVTEAGEVTVAKHGNFRGKCTVRSGRGAVRICRKVNGQKFNQFLMDGLGQL